MGRAKQITADDIAYPAATAIVALGITEISPALFEPSSPVAFYTFRALYLGRPSLHRLQIMVAMKIRGKDAQDEFWKMTKAAMANSDTAIERACKIALEQRRIVHHAPLRADIDAEAARVAAERAEVQRQFEARLTIASIPESITPEKPAPVVEKPAPARFKPVVKEPHIASRALEQKPKSEKHAALDAEIYGAPLPISRRGVKTRPGASVYFPGDKDPDAVQRVPLDDPEEVGSAPETPEDEEKTISKQVEANTSRGWSLLRRTVVVTLPRVPSLERELP